MKRLAALPLWILALCLLGSGSAVAGSDTFHQVYLPLVPNPPPPGALVWNTKSALPYWVTYISAATSSDGYLYGVVLYPTYDHGDGDIHALAYDPQSDSWTLRPGKISAPPCCYSPTVATASAKNGRIYVVLGDLSSGFTTLEYDPGTDTWAKRAVFTAGVQFFGLAGATNGKLYAVGGSNAAGAALASTEIYDPATNTWTSGPTMPTAIADPNVVGTADGKIYAFGNGVGEVYDSVSGAWSVLPRPTVLVTNEMGAAQAGDGKIYLAGGPTNYLGIPSGNVFVYDPTNGSWSSQTSLPAGREDPSVAVLNGTEVFVIGGDSGAGLTNGVVEATIGQ